MLLHIKDILSKQSYQAKQFSTYENRLENMSNKNNMRIKFDTARTENEKTFEMEFDKFKAKASIYIYMKLLTINPNKHTSSYDQTSDDTVKWPLLK